MFCVQIMKGCEYIVEVGARRRKTATAKKREKKFPLDYYLVSRPSTKVFLLARL